MNDYVNNPKHYNSHPSGIECIEITQHMDFLIGNAIKYLWRCGMKDDDIQELKKAIWYIERKIAMLESENFILRFFRNIKPKNRAILKLHSKFKATETRIYIRHSITALMLYNRDYCTLVDVIFLIRLLIIQLESDKNEFYKTINTVNT